MFFLDAYVFLRKFGKINNKAKISEVNSTVTIEFTG